MTLFSHEDSLADQECQRKVRDRQKKRRKSTYLDGLSELTVEERLAKIEEQLYDLTHRDET